MEFLEFQFPEPVQYWTNLVLVWVGYGTLTGLLAKAIMPGRDPGGSIAPGRIGPPRGRRINKIDLFFVRDRLHVGVDI